MKENVANQGVKYVDVLLGSPPCQAHSAVGKARLSLNRAETDPRIFLYKYFIEMVKKFKPKFFVFEKVPSIKTTLNGELFKDMTRKLEKMHYTVEPHVLNSKDYFILQSRKRMILGGWSKDINGEYPFPEEKKHNYIISDLLDDLPSLKPGEGKNVMDYNGPPSDYLKSSGIRFNWNILTHHIARPHNERDMKIYRKSINAWETASKRLMYIDLPEELQTHKNKKSFLDRFKVVAGNKKYSHTIVAHIAKDGHYYIHPDIKQSRSLTVREAARIQSFPDDYYFEGPRTARYRQVGNAVPPLLAQGIAQKIKEMLN
jgi:DNA (cytosine-5)-methyltransferase 1